MSNPTLETVSQGYKIAREILNGHEQVIQDITTAVAYAPESIRVAVNEIVWSRLVGPPEAAIIALKVFEAGYEKELGRRMKNRQRVLKSRLKKAQEGQLLEGALGRIRQEDSRAAIADAEERAARVHVVEELPTELPGTSSTLDF